MICTALHGRDRGAVTSGSTGVQDINNATKRLPYAFTVGGPLA